jgi:capsular exopolysaccharide synthesis family protein
MARFGGLGGWSDRRSAAKLHTAQEAFRVLRSNLLVAIAELDNPSIVITSAAENEGKTSTSVAIAQSMAANGSHVVLVDLDLRDPDAHRLLGGHNGFGVSDVLLGQMALEECLQRVTVQVGESGQTAELRLLAAGPAVTNPTELLSSPQMGKLLDDLATTADIVFLDTAPVLSVADTLVIGRRAAGAVLVVEARHTPLPTVKRAKDALVRNQMRLLGVVLNKFDPKFADDDYDVAGLGYGSESGGLRSTGRLRPATAVPHRRPGRLDRSSAPRWLLPAVGIAVVAAVVIAAVALAGGGDNKAEAGGKGLPEPTTNPATATTSAPAAKTKVDGVGDAVVRIARPGGAQAPTIVRAAHETGGEFALTAGADTLVHTTGTYEGSTLLADPDSTELVIKSDGSWRIEFRSLERAQAWDGTAQIFKGDQVLSYRGGGGQVDLQYGGANTFAVRSCTLDGACEELADRRGAYRGSASLVPGPVLVAVKANGAYWGAAVTG